MINKQYKAKFWGLGLAALTFVFIGMLSSETNAQTRDPFAKPGWARTKESKPGSPGAPGKTGPGPVVNLGIPSIESRIDYFKRLRESAAVNGQPLPKVTSVLSLNEMSVTGIFKTPRGYAAMVEATPIKLSYTIYPGEKFFDGQLVAVEENRLVFRKVQKMSNGKFVTSVENMALRKYTDREQIQGTAPMGSDVAQNERPKEDQTAAAGPDGKPTAPTAIVSPLDEMANQSQESSNSSKTSKKAPKRPAKVAKKNQ